MMEPLFSPSTQEVIVFAVVFLVMLNLLWKGFRSFGAAPLSAWLLKRGKVKWAMKVKARAATGGGACDHCGPANSGGSCKRP